MVELTRCYTKNPAIIEKDLPDGPVLIDPYRRVMVPLDPVGREIWRLIDGSQTIADMVRILGGTFDVGEETLRRDVTSFLRELAKREMIT